MARPKKSSDKMYRFLKVRVTEEDEATVKAKVKDAGFSLSEYTRRLWLNGQVVAQPSLIDIKTYCELNRIGVNINQGIKKLHETGRNSDALVQSLERLNGFLDCFGARL